ncbi:RNHCP domain-containing protein [Clostridium sp. AM58-1XD]|uniref:RNHCP domain-containing protein n=1 Tax=Clostridium sp. AM58-1XD TaxID=2292307 RepID=UPI00325BDFDA
MVDILPRDTSLYRGDRRAKGEEILIAANADQVIAVVTADYFMQQAGFAEAAIIAAKRAGIRVGVFISKWDTAGESIKKALCEKMELYRKSADFILAGSARACQDELAPEVRGKTTVIVGDRSCGKTSLILGILETLGENVRPETNLPGTHTTELYAGPDETFLIDTPGFRDFCLSNVSVKEREETFPEIAGWAVKCYFSSCTHTYEDGCQVIQGLREKKIKRERYDAWRKMSESARSGRQASEISIPKIDYRHRECRESFLCKECGEPVAPDGAGSRHRNHCPKCLSSVHVDIEPGDRASLCSGIMDPIGVWVRRDGEWAIIHRCRLCGELSSNRIAADDNPALLMSIAVRPLARTPFPLDKIQELYCTNKSEIR